MKCFDVRPGYVYTGFDIHSSKDGFHIPFKSEDQRDKSERVLKLSPEIVRKLEESSQEGLFRHRSSRLMHCDFEDRVDLWLTESTPEFADHALVLARTTPHGQKGYNLVCEANIQALDGAKIVAEHSWSMSEPEKFFSAGVLVSDRVVLAIMPPGSKLIFNAFAYEKPVLRSRTKKRAAQNTTSTAMIFKDGKMEQSKV